MGESKDVWAERVGPLTPYQVNAAVGENRYSVVSSCTAFLLSMIRTPSWGGR